MRTALAGALLAAFTIAAPPSRPAAWGSRPANQESLDSDAGKERFLREARVVRTREIGKGVTGAIRATLTDGVTTHDAQIQVIEERKLEFQSARTVEFQFRDSWSFNVVAYRLDRMLGLNLVPVSIERRHSTEPGAFTWWIDDVMMDETARLKKKIAPPRPAEWNQEMQLVRLFDQLIYNTDRNTGNLLITKDWGIWAIDHTRAFRRRDTLRAPSETVTVTLDVAAVCNVPAIVRVALFKLRPAGRPVAVKVSGAFSGSLAVSTSDTAFPTTPVWFGGWFNVGGRLDAAGVDTTQLNERDAVSNPSDTVTVTS